MWITFGLFLCEHDHFMDYWSHFDCLFRFVLICQSLFCFVNRAEFPYIERFRTCFRATYPHIKSHNVQVPHILTLSLSIPYGNHSTGTTGAAWHLSFVVAYACTILRLGLQLPCNVPIYRASAHEASGVTFALSVQLPHMRRHSVSGLSLWAYLVRFLLA